MATAGRGDLINSAWPRKRKRTGSPYLLLAKPAESHFEVWYDWFLGVDGVKFLYSNNPITISQTGALTVTSPAGWVYVNGTTQGNSSAASVTVAKPSGTLEGHLIVVTAYIEADTNSWASVGAGFTSITTSTNTGALNIQTWWKWCGASEPASWTWTGTSSGWMTVDCVVFSGGSGTGNPVETFAVDQGDSIIGGGSSPSITTLSANALVLACYGNFSGSNASAVSGATTVLRTALGGTMISSGIKATAGATGTTTYTGLGTETYASMTISFALVSGGSQLLAGTTSITAGQTALLDLTKPIAATNGITLSQIGNINLEKQLAANEPITVGQSAQLTFFQLLQATTSVNVSQTGEVNLTIPLNTSTPIVIGQVADVALQKPLSGSTPISVNQTGAILLSVLLGATNSLTTSQVGALQITKPLGATEPITIGQSGVLSLTELLNAVTAVSINQAANLTNTIPLGGSTSITVNQTAVLAGIVTHLLAASENISIGQSGSLNIQKQLSGVTPINLGQNGVLALINTLAGTTSLTTSQNASIDLLKSLQGTSGITLDQISALAVTGSSLQGLASVVLGQAAQLQNTVPLGGTSALSVNASSPYLTLLQLLAGTSLVAIGQNATIVVQKPLNGSTTVVMGNVGTIQKVTPLTSVVALTVDGSGNVSLEKSLGGSSSIVVDVLTALTAVGSGFTPSEGSGLFVTVNDNIITVYADEGMYVIDPDMGLYVTDDRGIYVSDNRKIVVTKED